MNRTNKQWLAMPLACAVLGLAGCATPESEPGTTTTSQAPTRILGAGRYVPAMLSPTDCMKFEALPYECEVLLRR